MRQLMNLIFNLIVSVLLICAGLYVLYEELFVSYSGIHGRYQPLGVGLILFGSGVVWLWWYVVGPIVLKRLSREEWWRLGSSPHHSSMSSLIAVFFTQREIKASNGRGHD
jgi:divalent metal cation (Fe/Co/Zn/Cd) transporter